MAEIKLFDTWTFQEEMPEPFSQFLKSKRKIIRRIVLP